MIASESTLRQFQIILLESLLMSIVPKVASMMWLHCSRDESGSLVQAYSPRYKLLPLVGKHLLLKLIMALPPGFSTLCISFENLEWLSQVIY